MTSKKLCDAEINEAFILGDSLVAAIDSIDRRLEDLSEYSVENLNQIVFTLNQIIERFGGTADPDIILEVEITPDDIANNKNVIFFSQDPMIDVKIDWGD